MHLPKEKLSFPKIKREVSLSVDPSLFDPSNVFLSRDVFSFEVTKAPPIRIEPSTFLVELQKLVENRKEYFPGDFGWKC